MTTNAKDLHRPPLHPGDDLEDAFAWKEERTVSQALTLQYDKVVFVLMPSEQAKSAIGKRVTIFDYPDGRLAIRHKAWNWRIGQSISCGRCRRPILSRTSGWVRLSPLSASSRLNAPKPAAARRPADAIKPMRVCSRLAEVFYEPSELTLTR